MGLLEEISVRYFRLQNHFPVQHYKFILKEIWVSTSQSLKEGVHNMTGRFNIF